MCGPKGYGQFTAAHLCPFFSRSLHDTRFLKQLWNHDKLLLFSEHLWNHASFKNSRVLAYAENDCEFAIWLNEGKIVIYW